MIDQQRLLQTFLDFVTVDSETGDEAAMCRLVEEQLRGLGCQVFGTEPKESLRSTGNNVCARLPGTADLPPILMSAHLDTVVPGKGVRPVLEADGYLRSAGDTVLGGDDKAGVCAILEALRTVVEKDLPHRTVEIAFTVREESGLLGAKALDYSQFTAREAVVLDSSGDVGKLMVGAPGQIKLRATVCGRAAHAGVAPELGVSAIQVAARAVAAMQLLRIDQETTANIGTFTAVGPTNIVSERAFIEAEIRSRSVEKLQAQAQHMSDCLTQACQEGGATLELNTEVSYLSYLHDENTPIVRRVAEACRALEIPCTTALSGGGSDANIFNQQGISTINLGVGMEKVHTTAEQISLTNLHRGAQLALALMQ